MKRTAFFVLISTAIIFSGTVYAQTQKVDPQAFNSEKEELLLKKEVLLKEKQELTDIVAHLLTQLDELDAKLKIALPKFYIKKYGKADGSRVAMGQIWKGMAEQMMRDSWGEPDKSNTDRFSYGVFKQLYYGKVIYFFRDGKLIDWEEDK